MEWVPWGCALSLCAIGAVIVFFWNWITPSGTSLEGEVALVTGGASGLGKLIAVKLARLGAKVVVWDVNTVAITAMVEEAKSSQLSITAEVVDVSNPTAIREAAARVVSVGTLENLTDRQIERTFQINTLAHFHTARAFVPKMKATNHGHIVTMASILGYMGMPQLTDYTASKAAAIIMHESLALELRSFKAYTGHRVLKLPLLFITTPIYMALPMFLKMLGVDILVGDTALASVKGTNPPSDRQKTE